MRAQGRTNKIIHVISLQGGGAHGDDVSGRQSTEPRVDANCRRRAARNMTSDTGTRMTYLAEGNEEQGGAAKRVDKSKIQCRGNWRESRRNKAQKKAGGGRSTEMDRERKDGGEGE